MRKFYHFIEKPVMSRQQRIIEQQKWELEVPMFKKYAIFLGIVFSACLFGSALSWNSEDDELHTLVCKTTPTSEICTNRSMFDTIGHESKKKWVPLGLVLGIAFAESSLHTNYNKPHCKAYHNHWWLKGYKLASGKVLWYDNKKGHDWTGCWFYKFESLEQGLDGLTNTLSVGYKGCKYDVRCISYNFVGKPDVAEESWIGRVNKFYK